VRLLRNFLGQAGHRSQGPPPTPEARALGVCVVCGSTAPPVLNGVLWQSLIDDWGLSSSEAASVDRREGQQCPHCGTTLRSAALALAILHHVGWPGTFDSWASSCEPQRILEINRAGQLTPWLDRIEGHLLVQHPDVDMQRLTCADGAWDLVVHSDTLEHVEDPVAALAECRRILAPGGALCFTIPVIGKRLTRRRDGLSPSYHGSESDPAYLVVTEYGGDFWTQVLDAGFTTLRVDTLQWPDAMALTATCEVAGRHTAAAGP
jgi:SAM-dependent methyltransferase